MGGFDETFEGWGFEDSDLAVRLLNAGVRRKEGAFATGVLHLWHRENDRRARRAQLGAAAAANPVRRDAAGEGSAAAPCAARQLERRTPQNSPTHRRAPASGRAPPPRIRALPGHAPAEGRYKNIDVLRGVAALCVVWLHASEVLVTLPAVRASGTLLHDIPNFLQLGRAGVIAFFAISGFVVASTIRLPKYEATLNFGTRRLFRLYPAYWTALALTYLVIWWPQGRVPGLASVVANATMLPTVFGVESAMGHFWTLEIEFVFYLLVVVLFLADKLRDPRLIVALIVVLALKPAAVRHGQACAGPPARVTGASCLCALCDHAMGQPVARPLRGGRACAAQAAGVADVANC